MLTGKNNEKNGVLISLSRDIVSFSYNFLIFYESIAQVLAFEGPND